MHKPNDHGKAAGLQRIQDKLRQLTPEEKTLFLIYVAFLSGSRDNLPPAFELPDQER